MMKRCMCLFLLFAVLFGFCHAMNFEITNATSLSLLLTSGPTTHRSIEQFVYPGQKATSFVAADMHDGCIEINALIEDKKLDGASLTISLDALDHTATYCIIATETIVGQNCGYEERQIIIEVKNALQQVLFSSMKSYWVWDFSSDQRFE